MSKNVDRHARVLPSKQTVGKKMRVNVKSVAIIAAVAMACIWASNNVPVVDDLVG